MDRNNAKELSVLSPLWKGDVTPREKVVDSFIKLGSSKSGAIISPSMMLQQEMTHHQKLIFLWTIFDITLIAISQ